MTTLDDYQGMDFSTLEDKMDVGSSPYPHVEGVDDLDFEFDQMDNQAIELTNDKTMNDNDTHSPDNAFAQPEEIEFFEDEDVEEETSQDATTGNDHADPNNPDEEEEILYEEEEEPATANDMHQQVDGSGNPLEPEYDDHPLDLIEPTDYQEYEAKPADLPNSSTQNDDPANSHEYTDEQYERDDGDGPSIDPTTTELSPDPNVNPQQPRDEATLQLEEDFADELQERSEGAVAPETSIGPNTTMPEPVIEETQEEQTTSTRSFDLHPVTLTFFDQEFVLFPPSEVDAAVALFPDTSLAYEPIDRLLRTCLPKLPLPEHFSHHDELVLSISDLGLQISEDSRSASQLNLAQIVDLYCSFHHNQNLNPSGPMRCDLTSRTCTMTQFAYLEEQLHAGATFSDIVAQHVDTPAEDDDEAEVDLADGDGTQAGASGEDDDAQVVEENTYQDIEQGPELGTDRDSILDEYNDQDPGDAPLQNIEAEAQGLPVNAEASEFFEEAIDEQAEGEAEAEAEDEREQTEDQTVLQTAVAEDQAAAEALLEAEEAKDYVDDQQAPFDGEEFLIDEDGQEGNDQEGLADAETSTSNAQAAESGDVTNGNVAEDAAPITPSKNSKRKIADEEEDFLIDFETPEPKRRRPS